MKHETTLTVAVTRICKKHGSRPFRVDADHKARYCLVCLWENDPRILNREQLVAIAPYIKESSFPKTEIEPLCSCPRVPFKHVHNAEFCRRWIVSYAA